VKVTIQKNGLEETFEGNEGKAAFTTFILLNAEKPAEALGTLHLIQSFIESGDTSLTAKIGKFKIRISRVRPT